jgi:hypothetical protein
MSELMERVAATLGLPANSSTAAVFAEVDRVVALRRDRLVAAAVADGRLIQASRATWRLELNKGVAAERQLAALTSVKVVPVEEDALDHVIASFGVDTAKSKARRSA